MFLLLLIFFYVEMYILPLNANNVKERIYTARNSPTAGFASETSSSDGGKRIYNNGAELFYLLKSTNTRIFIGL